MHQDLTTATLDKYLEILLSKDNFFYRKEGESSSISTPLWSHCLEFEFQIRKEAIRLCRDEDWPPRQELATWKREITVSRREVTNLRRTIQSAPAQQPRLSLKGNNRGSNGKCAGKTLAIQDTPKGKGKGRKAKKAAAKGRGKTSSRSDLLINRQDGLENIHVTHIDAPPFCFKFNRGTAITPVLTATVKTLRTGLGCARSLDERQCRLIIDVGWAIRPSSDLFLRLALFCSFQRNTFQERTSSKLGATQRERESRTWQPAM